MLKLLLPEPSEKPEATTVGTGTPFSFAIRRMRDSRSQVPLSRSIPSRSICMINERCFSLVLASKLQVSRFAPPDNLLKLVTSVAPKFHVTVLQANWLRKQHHWS